MKKNIDIARAWRDEDYYLSLSEEDRSGLGTHPAGVFAVDDEILREITGGCGYAMSVASFCTPCPGKYCGG